MAGSNWERSWDFPGEGSVTCMAVSVKVLPRGKIDGTGKYFNLNLVLVYMSL